MPGICEGRVVIVTGAGRGIGRGHALEFAAQGAKVVVNDLGAQVDGTGGDAGPANEVVEAIEAMGGEAIANGDDVSDFEGARQLIDAAVERFGRLDVLVNNAGILRDRMLINMTPEEWDAVIRVHLRGTYAPAHHAAVYWRELVKAGGTNDARIINTSSSSGIYGNPGQTNYGAAKAGIAAFTIIAAMELGRYGITVNAIAPGALTRMTEGLRPGRDSPKPGEFDARSPDNIAPLVVWLGSSESAGITGRVFNVAGGSISVAEGWHPGPAVDKRDRWDPAELGAVIPGLVERAAPNEAEVRRRGSLVKFGIFYEHQLPRPWEEDSEYQILQDALEQCVLADKLGFDYVWEVEHHFLEEYSHSSAPEVFLAAVSQRTSRIKLGHGIVQTPPPFNHPARVAERIATLDLISDGRVQFGTGEAGSEAELGGFMIDRNDKRAMWEEGLRVALRCLTETPFTGHAGPWVTMPPRNVVPKPRQKPHPPVWVACSRRETIHLAAQKGIGALTFAFIDPEEAHHWVTDYYSTFENECVPIGDAVNPNVAGVTTFMCAPTEEMAIERGTTGANFFGYSLAHYYLFGQHHPGVTDVWSEFEQRRAEYGYDPEAVRAAARNPERLGATAVQQGATGLRGAVGTPEQIREYLRRYEQLGVDQVVFVSQAGRNRHEHIMESLELFGRTVLPEFAERDEKLTAEKEARLAPVIERVMARKPADDHPPLPSADYSFPATPRAAAERAGADDFLTYIEQIATQRALGIATPSGSAHPTPGGASHT